MPIDPRIPLSGEAPAARRFDVTGAITRGMTLSGLRQENEIGQRGLDEADKARELDEARGRDIVRTARGEIDFQQTINNLMRRNDHEAIEELQQARATAEEAAFKRQQDQANLTKTRQEIQSKGEEELGSAAGGVVDQASFDRFLEVAPEDLRRLFPSDTFDDQAASILQQLIAEGISPQQQITNAQTAQRDLATQKNRRLIAAETAKHRKKMQELAGEGNDLARTREKNRHAERMKRLEAGSGVDKVAERQRAQEDRAEVRRLDEKRFKLTQTQGRLRAVLDVPDKKEFSYVNKSGSVVEGKMNEQIRKGIRDEMVRSEKELLRVGKRATELKFGDKVVRITPFDLNAYAFSEKFPSKADAEVALFDQGVVVDRGP